MGTQVNYSGLVVAGVGFFLTRFTVTLAIYDDPARFYLAGVVPLVLGLGLATFGVALAVADVDPAYVRTIAAWCVVGAGTMGLLVALTLLGSQTGGGMPGMAQVRQQTYLSNFLIGGSVGGTLTGVYAAGTRRHRDAVARQANRLEILNRLLRHEVLNGVAVIGAYNDHDGDGDAAERVIADRTDEIERTIEEVTRLTRRAGPGGDAGNVVDLGACLERSVATVTERHPSASVAVAGDATGLRVRGTERLDRLFTELVENAVLHADDPEPTVRVTASATEVVVAVEDGGDGLPDHQRRLLETGEIREFDDPSSGFGLNVARFLAEDAGGRVDTDVDAAGTTVRVTLRRATPSSTTSGPVPVASGDLRPLAPQLVVTFLAAVVAGVAYGVASQLQGGSVAGIGVFYGAPSPVVGWITHEFHSVVFGFVYAGLLTQVPPERRDRPLTYLAVGVGWALALWALAAGVVAPLWLRALDIPAAVPHLSGTLLVSHLVWGVSLATLTAVGYAHVVPQLAARTDAGAPRSQGD